ncbi:uncharacterized protein LOC112344863 [Selaginella moellendorffii]|uniref:uncharacterized protein LOC112344863 n=1 Tax=Selaginella moellendorffii TaxID=88036 RepID=UPI000D1C46CB|nr:uncharacterized protein LOC112344863 [Selaginella moellendorffii]|eukprot:XP_024526159.1 uncharacterized protein LOC112344863 [Selaginella moellendorffii]
MPWPLPNHRRFIISMPPSGIRRLSYSSPVANLMCGCAVLAPNPVQLWKTLGPAMLSPVMKLTVESYVERFRPLCCVRGAVQDQVLGRDSRPSDGDRGMEQLSRVFQDCAAEVVELQGDSGDAGGCGYLLDACAVSFVQVVHVHSKRKRDIQLDGRVECGDRLYDPLGFVAVSRPPVVAHVHHLDPLGAPSPGNTHLVSLGEACY